MKYGIAGVIVGLILLIWAPWAALGVIAAAIIIPAIAYAMLDPSQRRRVRRAARPPVHRQLRPARMHGPHGPASWPTRAVKPVASLLSSA